MFFILSKLLSFILSPIWWITILLLSYFILKNFKKRKWLLVTAISILLIFSNQLLFYHVSGWWENDFKKYEEVKCYDGIILLGGFSSYRAEENRLQFSKSADRLLQAVDLYKGGKAKYLIFTGGSSRIIQRTKSGGEFMKEFLMRLGIPQDSLLVEWNARNTYENAVETKKLLGNVNLEQGKYLIVTSGFHLKRAMGCFEKAGIDVVPFKTDALQSNLPPEIWECITPSASVLATWELLFKEWIGYVVYKIRGYV